MKQTAILPGVFLGLLLAAPGSVDSRTPVASTLAHEDQPPAGAGVAGYASRVIALDVVVSGKSGQPVAGLEARDFKLFDNKQPIDIVSFQAANGMKAKADPPVELILLIDAINAPFETIAMERHWLAAFFRENGGELALPTRLVILTDDGMNLQNRPTREGKTLQAFLDANATGLRHIRRSEGKQGALDREQSSLSALNLLALQLSNRPGRKLLFWLSHGWNVISDPRWIGGEKDRQAIYGSISSLSTELRKARIALYCISPFGGYGRDENYMKYLKGVDSPDRVDIGDLLLPVIATQTGGQVPYAGNDLAIVIDRCIADAHAYYVLTFNAPVPAHPDEYHGIEVQVDKPGLKVRTRTAYYADSTVQGEKFHP
jgi:VWFA-related protein